MRAQTFEDPTRLNPTRTVAMATAIAVHIGAVLFLIAPARPEAQAQLDNRVINDVFIIEPPMAPPPPPPPADDPPPPPPVPARIPPPVRQPTPVEPTTNTEPAVTDSSELITDEPASDPVIAGPATTESFTDARADVRYGAGARLRYPSISIRKKEQGEVQLRVLVGIDGAPRQVELARTSGFRNLDAAAKKTVMSWRFVPAERNGSTVEAWVIVPIRFNLSEA
jgi:periplasmic protein TonB